MTVHSIAVSSPIDSSNTLLMDHAGTQIPLTVQSVLIESNSAMTMISSALQLNGPNGVGMQIGGEFNQNDSVVAGRQINVGYIGPGAYNFNSGVISVEHVWVGGPFSGIFNQMGGSNSVGIVHLENGGTYNLEDGDFFATLYFPDGGLLRQTGGRMEAPVTIHKGTYLLEGGSNYGGVVAPTSDGWTGWGGSGDVVQTGGTNFGPLYLGMNGYGSYTLSNGFCITPTLTLGGGGTFALRGGCQTVNGDIHSTGTYIGRASDTEWLAGYYSLEAGTLSVSNMSLEGDYNQSGGTNHVAGSFVARGSVSLSVHVRLRGGVLIANDVDTYCGISQSGGLMIVTNQFTISRENSGIGMPYFGPDFSLTGGELVVSNILLKGTYFGFSSEARIQAGALEMQSAGLMPTAGFHQFGELKVDSLSIVVLPPAEFCLIGFGNCSHSVWSGKLIITNWSGSLYGGGSHQIIFGTDSDALTTQQLSQIQFQNPAGLAPGTYPARILATGEIVPDTGAPLAPKIEISGELTNDAIQLRVEGDIGQTYGIESSTDLVHWLMWTSYLNASGTIPISENAPTNFPQLFYRTRLLP
ncbi:MAG TPA: hypothetical protein VFM25_14185 [Verrucomicrobiae bacterium]|nr:hypothetical protein [Verrucomicrobiae bacterium]